MQRTLSEQRVLKQLGISDFRYMTKEKILKFATMLPYMDPEVAKRALDQFPAFTDLAGQLVTEYRYMADRMFTENSVSQNAFYQACGSILDSLKKELQRETISSDERAYIEDKMLEVAAMIGEKDSENKHFLASVIAIIGFVTAGIIGTAAAILGSNFQSTSIGGPDANWDT